MGGAPLFGRKHLKDWVTLIAKLKQTITNRLGEAQTSDSPGLAIIWTFDGCANYPTGSGIIVSLTYLWRLYCQWCRSKRFR